MPLAPSMSRLLVRKTLPSLCRRFTTGHRRLSPNLDQELDRLAELAAESKKSSVEFPSEAEVESYQLIEAFKKYDPKVQTEWTEVPRMNRPLPISAELNYYAPLKHRVKYGDLKADVMFKCFDPRNLQFFCDFALRAAYYLGMPATGPRPIPVRRERWTVNRAPFVHAKSKENFERRTYGRVLKIWDTKEEVVDTWLAYLKNNSVWGVGVKVHMHVSEPVELAELEPLGETAYEDLGESLKALSKDRQNPVAGKVLELLQDPIFRRHMKDGEEVEVAEKKTESEEKTI